MGYLQFTYLQVIFVIVGMVCLRYGAAANVKINNEMNNHLSTKAPADSNSLKYYIRNLSLLPTTAQHVVGTTIELTCQAYATPAPTIRWLKNNQPIKDYDLESNVILESSQTSLAKVTSIFLISKPSTNFEDKYTCVVFSGLNTERISATVYNIGPNSEPSEYHHHITKPIKPKIILRHILFMENIGSTAVIPCKSYGYPRPHITWFDNNNNIILRRSRRMRVLRTGELIITNLRWADMGKYECCAKNALGNDTSQTFLYPLKPE